jgi:hypothetical protein
VTGATVTERALLKRINRKLAHEDGSAIRKARPESHPSLGDFYTWVAGQGCEVNVDPEDFGRELGVLLPGETVVWS